MKPYFLMFLPLTVAAYEPVMIACPVNEEVTVSWEVKEDSLIHKIDSNRSALQSNTYTITNKNLFGELKFQNQDGDRFTTGDIMWRENANYLYTRFAVLNGKGELMSAQVQELKNCTFD
ncbi:hypothetical protein F0231_20800 [Vibrio sp. RE86]|uniref:hypothetical protein n=1 Tax=Vibrio sp. RE86 TaxID=2607605 RepID=UPI0014938D0C|nr:hypothetical protein [Vibrio sp. RE86]NOH82151.1 hypothetical protein [Vibrio sp. RE86]